VYGCVGYVHGNASTERHGVSESQPTPVPTVRKNCVSYFANTVRKNANEGTNGLILTG